MKPSAFHTRSRANEGRLMPLSLPDGQKTDEWLRIYGYDADPVVTARAKYRGLAVDNAAKPKDEQLAPETFAENNKFVVLVPAVKEWSFTEVPCTPENVQEFLAECPHIADEVERLVYNRTDFFKETSTPSLTASSADVDSKPE